MRVAGVKATGSPTAAAPVRAAPNAGCSWSDETRTLQANAFGMTGAGKTNLLETVTEQDILRGAPIIFIDGKGDKQLFEVAKAVGYDSDAAFSKAFKRSLGVPPREYQRTARAG